MFTVQDINKVVSAALATYEKAHTAQEENAMCSLPNRQKIHDDISRYVDGKSADEIALLICAGNVPHVSVRWIL